MTVDTLAVYGDSAVVVRTHWEAVFVPPGNGLAYDQRIVRDTLVVPVVKPVVLTRDQIIEEWIERNRPQWQGKVRVK